MTARNDIDRPVGQPFGRQRRRQAAYVAAKHGLVGLTKVVAIETADHGITCNAICPGWVMTPLIAQQVEAHANKAGKPLEEAKQEFVAGKQPMARYTRPEDIGALAVFRASAKTIRVAWQTAVGSDLSLPEVAGPRPPSMRITNAYLNRVMTAAETDPTVTGQFMRVIGLIDPPVRLLRPSAPAFMQLR